MGLKDTGCDAVVIGGGVIGCTTAFRLAQAGLRVTIVERGACGRESSWAGAGIIDAGSPARDDPLARLRRASVARYPRFIDELRSYGDVDPEYQVCGSLGLLTDDQQEAAAQRILAACADERTPDGAPMVELLSPHAVRALEPALQGDVRGALLQRDTAQVRNPRLMAALRAACERSGVKIREGVTVRDLIVRDSRVRGVLTDAGPVDAAWTILAAGAWSSRISERLTGLVDVHPVRGQIVLYERRPPLLRHIVRHGRHYIVCRGDGHLLVGSTQEPQAGFDKRPSEKGVSRLTSFAERYVPAIRDAVMQCAWTGLRPGTPDKHPYIGPVSGLDGLIAATGHFRTGLALAPITAELVKQLVTSGATEFDLSRFLPGPR
ncbi:MAG: glycine oxidase ThiO [Phycisphaerae bacterium]